MIDQIFEEKKIFETERLLLIPTTKDDFEIFQQLFTNEKVTEFLNISHKQESQKLRMNFENLLSVQNQKHIFAWKMVLKENNQPIGRINIASIVRKSARLDLGFVLLPKFWGIGIMSEAVNQLIKYLFNEINVHKITATTNNENLRSKKILVNYGFNLEGILKEHNYYAEQEKYIDDAIYGLFKK